VLQEEVLLWDHIVESGSIQPITGSNVSGSLPREITLYSERRRKKLN
jgi:hypothetical protein